MNELKEQIGNILFSFGLLCISKNTKFVLGKDVQPTEDKLMHLIEAYTNQAVVEELKSLLEKNRIDMDSDDGNWYEESVEDRINQLSTQLKTNKEGK